MDIIRLNRRAHLLQLLSASNINTTNSADLAEGLKDVILRLGASEESNKRDDALVLDGLEGLLHGILTTNLDDVVDALAVGGQLAGGLAPVLVLAVVDDVVGAEFFERLHLLGGRGGGNDAGTGGLGELQREEGDAAGALDENGLAGLEGLEAVEGVPRGQTGAGEGGGLDVGKVGGGADDAVLVEDAVLAESAVENTAEAGGGAAGVDGTGLVGLVEEGDDLVTLLPLGDLGADGEDLTGTIGAGNDGEVEREGVHALWCVSVCSVIS